MTDECIFCRLGTGKIPCHQVYVNEEAMAFLDISPVSPGHTLIIPKKHYASLIDVPDDLLGRLYVLAKKLLPAVKRSTAADYVIVNVVGTDIPHFHIHLIPRNHNDGLKGWPTTKYAAGAEEALAEKIRLSITN